MIVVDVGCHTHAHRPDHDSVRELIGRFDPDLVFGFDPHPDLVEGVERIGGAFVVRSRLAAWTHVTYKNLRLDGLSTGLDNAGADVLVPCFDLCAFLASLPPVPTVLKIDAEGSEYPLLDELHERGLDARLQLVLVEWHDEARAHGMYGPRSELRCPAEEWD